MTNSAVYDLVTTIGIDLGKNSFHLIGMDKHGKILWRQKLARGQLEERLVNRPPCLIGLEACAGAHHIGRYLTALGHEVRLIPAQYVKPARRQRPAKTLPSFASVCSPLACR